MLGYIIRNMWRCEIGPLLCVAWIWFQMENGIRFWAQNVKKVVAIYSEKMENCGYFIKGDITNVETW